MITISRFFSTLLILIVLSVVTVNGQSPIPVIVPGASGAAATPVSPPAMQDSGALKAALKTLQEMKAANEEMLKKQEATLQQLDEIQKAAEQLKIFSKRG